MNVFLSYRRKDTKQTAGRIADNLDNLTYIKHVFIDVYEIEPGADFVKRIVEAMHQSTHCLVLIGNDWIGAKPNKREARIHDEDDPIRLEVVNALASDAEVIPVLIDDAIMPTKEELPQDISSIALLNAVLVRHTSFKRDFASLVEAITGFPPDDRGWPERHPIFRVFLIIAIGLLVTGALLISAGVAHNLVTEGKALSETFGSTGLVYLLVLSSFITGGGIAAWLALRR